MKHLLFCILFSLLLQSCEDNSMQLYLGYIADYSETVNICNTHRQQFTLYMKREVDSIFGNPKKIKPWNEKALNIKNATDSLIYEIDQFKKKFFNTKNFDENTLNKRKKIEKDELEKLRISLEKYRSLMISLFDNQKDKKNYKAIVDLVDTSLSTKRWKHVPVLNGETRYVVEILAVLTKMQADIKTSEYRGLRFIFANIESRHDIFLNIEPIIMPESQTIHVGNEYQAEIFIGMLDTTSIPIIQVNDKSLPVKHGKAIYSEKVTQTTGIVSRTGKIILIQPATGDSIFILFSFEYEVIDE